MSHPPAPQAMGFIKPAAAKLDSSKPLQELSIQDTDVQTSYNALYNVV